MKKIMKITSSIILAIVMMVASIMNVKAASDTIAIGTATKVHHNYIANVTFSYKVTTDGRYLYCLDLHRNTASNIQAKLVSNSSYVDGGLLHILKNGYPNKSITGDSDKDYYITQTAVWWYLDSTHGASNLGNGFKNTGSDPYNLRGYVRNLVNEGIAHRGDSINATETKLGISAANGGNLTLQNGYYVSDNIKAVNTSNVSVYKVSLSNSLAGTKIVKSNGQEFTYVAPFEVGVNDSFKIKVPASSVKDTSYTITVEAQATGNEVYSAHEYQPVDSSMQNVVLLEKNRVTVKANTKLSIASSRVTITKVNSATKKALAGAELVLKNASGQVVERWTTTTEAKVIRNLADGEYTVEETKAPNGYVLSNKKVKVTIGKVRDVKVTFENDELGTLTIYKVDSKTKKALAGAELVLKNASGKVIDKWTSTTNGHVIKNIAVGTYTVEETKAPNGYALSNKKVKVTITENTKSAKVTFENEELGSLSIYKVDANTKKPLAGAVLELQDANGKIITTWTSTINAHVIKNLSAGTYKIREVSAPIGYIKSKNLVVFTIKDEVKAYKVTLENTPKDIVININKIDAETKKPLAGAVLVIKDSNGKIVSRFVTDETSHVITDIPNGTYTVEEESAPAGYIKSNEKITFTVDDDHQSHQITLENTKEVYVPDTGTESIIFLLIGTIIIGIGLDYVLKHAKA